MDDTRKDIFKKIHERCFQFGSCNYKETGCSDCPINVIIVKAETLLDKQEQGLLLIAPCKVGDTVYFPIYDYHDSAIIKSIRIEEKGIFLDWCQYEVGVDCTEVWDEGSLSIKDFGKTVFLTRSDAEEALAKMGGE